MYACVAVIIIIRMIIIITLVRSNARALLARCVGYNGGPPGDEFLV